MQALKGETPDDLSWGSHVRPHPIPVYHTRARTSTPYVRAHTYTISSTLLLPCPAEVVAELPAAGAISPW